MLLILSDNIKKIYNPNIHTFGLNYFIYYYKSYNNIELINENLEEYYKIMYPWKKTKNKRTT